MERSAPDAAELIRKARRIAVKVGSSLLVDGGGVRKGWIESLGADVAEQRAQGRELLLVSSGAVALGRDILGRPPAFPVKSADASL